MAREEMGGQGAVLDQEIQRAAAAGEAGLTVILVEGSSDRRAIEALAARQGRDLTTDGVTIIPIAGATNIDRFLEILGPNGQDVPLAGLCDEAEEEEFRFALGRQGLAVGPGRAQLERLGFYVCVEDLEDELIRALGPEAMLDLIESQGQLRRFHSFQNQPAQRHKTIEAQLRRWLGNHKIRYAPLMVEALDLERVPRACQPLTLISEMTKTSSAVAVLTRTMVFPVCGEPIYQQATQPTARGTTGLSYGSADDEKPEGRNLWDRVVRQAGMGAATHPGRLCHLRRWRA